MKRFELSNFNSRPSARGDFHGLQLDGRLHISIHAPPRGATGLYAISSVYQIFQFTPLREGRHIRHVHVHCHPDFNSRPSARGDERCGGRAVNRIRFQFTPLREGRLWAKMQPGACTTFQFTPLREGRREEKGIPQLYGQISIHAPPRGATDLLRNRDLLHLFQFTPLREGRPGRLTRRW